MPEREFCTLLPTIASSTYFLLWPMTPINLGWAKFQNLSRLVVCKMSFIVHYVTGVNDHADEFGFDSRDDGLAWSEQVSQIKNMVASVNMAFGISRQQKCDEARRDEGYVAWMDYVDSFVRKWGNERLPKDIGDAYNEIKANVNVAW